ncbi:MAG: SMP-30/gluconolactonase/LRE family protein [Desulfohalobiaceae bacterium]
MRYIGLSFAVLVAVVALYLILWPAPIDPVGYEPPEPPEMTGVLEPNKVLRKAEHMGAGEFKGPEDIAVDEKGRVYAGTATGLIRRSTGSGTVETFAETGGRPLGMEFAPDGNLIVADAWKGLLSVDSQGQVQVLSTGSQDQPFGFTDDLDVASDGTIYFTDASRKFRQPEYILDMLEARPHGRLLRYDPGTGKTKTLMQDLYFANGVALSAEEDFVLVNETYRYRIIRYWLKGPQAGISEVFMKNLPGFPDNIDSTEDNRFWLAFFTKRNKWLDNLHPYPLLKSVLSKLPQGLWPDPEPYGFVAELNSQGEILGSFQDPGGKKMFAVTSAKEVESKLYLGSLYNDRIGALSSPVTDRPGD